MDPNTSARDIFFSKSHLTNPFTAANTESPSKGLQLSTLEKTASIGLSILIGSFTLLIGGVVAFYWITAKIKSHKIKQLAPPIPLFQPELNILLQSEPNILLVQSQPNIPLVQSQPNIPLKGILKNVKSDSPSKETKSKKQVKFSEEKKKKEITIENSVPISQSKTNLLEYPGIHLTPASAANLLADATAKMSYPTSVNKRRYPPLSVADTVKRVPSGVISEHGEKHNFLRNDEILELHKAISQKVQGFAADIDDRGRIVIQQQAVRGCSAAAVSMLIYPRTKTIDTRYLRMTNLEDDEGQQQRIKAAGLDYISTSLAEALSEQDKITTLQRLIQQHGSAIVDVNDGEIGGHAVVVDEISTDLKKVRLRDPHHGWAITITKQAFLNRISTGATTVLQLKT